MSYKYYVDSFISFLLIVFILILLVAIVIAHVVDGLLRGVNGRAAGTSRQRRLRLSELDKQLAELDFTPGDYRDVQLDELLAKDRYSEAQKIVTERMRQAIEQGDDDRIIFYREYQRRIDCGAA